jgi:hypothetical protein
VFISCFSKRAGLLSNPSAEKFCDADDDALLLLQGQLRKHG